MRAAWLGVVVMTSVGCGTGSSSNLDGGGSIVYRCGLYGLQPSCQECETLTGGSNTKPCVYCSAAGHVGLCTAPGASCFVAKPNDLDWCYCGPNQDPSGCPLPTDYCIVLADGSKSACVTCGALGSDGFKCQSGGTCHAATGVCN